MSHLIKRLLSALAFVVLGTSTLAQDLSQLLEKGLYLEEIKADLPEAVAAYEEMLAADKGHPELKLQARFRLATCHLKLGRQDAARQVLQGLLENMPDSDTLAGDRPGRQGSSLDHDLSKILEMALPELNRDQLIEAAFEGLVNTLGETAYYYDPRELENFTINSSNQLVGIGALLKIADGRLMIQGIIAKSPAEKNGLAVGDEILKIDDQSVSEFDSLNDMVAVIRGEKGTTVSLLVQLAENQGERLFEVVRDTVTLEERGPILTAVKDRWFLDDAEEIGAVFISQFIHHCAENFKERVDQLVEEGMKALVIDLRGNGGGSLAASHSLADLFLKGGLIVSTHYRNRPAEERHASEEQPYTFPVAVLVDAQTASASEIVAAALQDHKRAAIIGERTFGKGTIESLIKVAGGGAIKLPIATFHTPSGRSLRRFPDTATNLEWGVQPDPGQECRVPRLNRTINFERQMTVDIPLQRALAYCRAQLAK